MRGAQPVPSGVLDERAGAVMLVQATGPTRKTLCGQGTGRQGVAWGMALCGFALRGLHPGGSSRSHRQLWCSLTPPWASSGRGRWGALVWGSSQQIWTWLGHSPFW